MPPRDWCWHPGPWLAQPTPSWSTDVRRPHTRTGPVPAPVAPQRGTPVNVLRPRRRRSTPPDGTQQVAAPVVLAAAPAPTPAPPPAPARPVGVPAGAQHDPSTGGWLLVEPAGEGTRHRTWYPAGPLHSDGCAVDGHWHGTVVEQHPDGSTARVAEYRYGTPCGVWRSYRGESPLPEVDGLPAEVRSLTRHFDDDGLLLGECRLDDDGRQLTRGGHLVPDRPSGVPADAFWADAGWVQGRYGTDGQPVGLHRGWDASGVPTWAMYPPTAGDPEGGWASTTGEITTNPLAVAARCEDAQGVESAIAHGLAQVPGIARSAALDGLPSLAVRVLAEPPVAGAFARAPYPPPVHVDGLPLDAEWSVADQAWIEATVNPVTGLVLGQARRWTPPRSGDDHMLLEVRTYAGATDPSTRHRYTGSEPDPARLGTSVSYASDGTQVLRTDYLAGHPVKQVERTGPDAVAVRVFDVAGALMAERRVTLDGRLLDERWFGPADRVLLRAVPGPDPALESCRCELPDGSAVHGSATPGLDGQVVGTWTRTGPSIEHGQTTSVEVPAALGLTKSARTGEVVSALIWEAGVPCARSLVGLEQADWSQVGDTEQMTAEDLRRLVGLLASPSAALATLSADRLTEALVTGEALTPGAHLPLSYALRAATGGDTPAPGRVESLVLRAVTGLDPVRAAAVAAAVAEAPDPGPAPAEQLLMQAMAEAARQEAPALQDPLADEQAAARAADTEVHPTVGSAQRADWPAIGAGALTDPEASSEPGTPSGPVSPATADEQPATTGPAAPAPDGLLPAPAGPPPVSAPVPAAPAVAASTWDATAPPSEDEPVPAAAVTEASTRTHRVSLADVAALTTARTEADADTRPRPVVAAEAAEAAAASAVRRRDVHARAQVAAGPDLPVDVDPEAVALAREVAAHRACWLRLICPPDGETRAAPSRRRAAVVLLALDPTSGPALRKVVDGLRGGDDLHRRVLLAETVGTLAWHPDVETDRLLAELVTDQDPSLAHLAAAVLVRTGTGSVDLSPAVSLLLAGLSRPDWLPSVPDLWLADPDPAVESVAALAHLPEDRPVALLDRMLPLLAEADRPGRVAAALLHAVGPLPGDDLPSPAQQAVLHALARVPADAEVTRVLRTASLPTDPVQLRARATQRPEPVAPPVLPAPRPAEAVGPENAPERPPISAQLGPEFADTVAAVTRPRVRHA